MSARLNPFLPDRCEGGTSRGTLSEEKHKETGKEDGCHHIVHPDATAKVAPAPRDGGGAGTGVARRGGQRGWTGFPTKKIGITFRARRTCVAIVCFCMYTSTNCVFLQAYICNYLSLLQAHSVVVLVHQPPIAQASIVFSCTCVCARESNSARITHRQKRNAP
jgi:hypothetical protein